MPTERGDRGGGRARRFLSSQYQSPGGRSELGENRSKNLFRSKPSRAMVGPTVQWNMASTTGGLMGITAQLPRNTHGFRRWWAGNTRNALTQRGGDARASRGLLVPQPLTRSTVRRPKTWRTGPGDLPARPGGARNSRPPAMTGDAEKASRLFWPQYKGPGRSISPGVTQIGNRNLLPLAG